MPTFEIECGKHHGKVKARSPGAAWRKLTKSETKGFALLARYRELPLTVRSYWLGQGVWLYISPEGFDKLR